MEHFNLNLVVPSCTMSIIRWKTHYYSIITMMNDFKIKWFCMWNGRRIISLIKDNIVSHIHISSCRIHKLVAFGFTTIPEKNTPRGLIFQLHNLLFDNVHVGSATTYSKMIDGCILEYACSRVIL